MSPREILSATKIIFGLSDASKESLTSGSRIERSPIFDLGVDPHRPHRPT